ncbi:iron-containing redox enzyme family protein [Microbacterium sp. zg.B48]|uniref:iron-containing redox enzyme family protein n=1 Tax=Microbacterium sp. zg.B48 TaxID=2969408 RepID=UPI00214C7CA4|nr:iron-containing redox enzyme family protein [Microbacterium sp. zg.B48]MCR2763119.1 iron-containing redox enzyme family protein [Microbacterium sp. zg.B48]
MTITDVEVPSDVYADSRGPVSALLLDLLHHADPAGPIGDSLLEATRTALAASPDIAADDDLQFSLFLLYACAYGSLDWIDPDWEWHTGLLDARRAIESAFESELRRSVAMPEPPVADAEAIAAALFALTAPTPGPSLSRFLAKRATLAQAREFLVQRSVYTLREADPHSWAIPRLTGRPKAALVEIQSDEYGGGRPERMHAEIFARTMRGAGLDPTYGRYVHLVPAVTLASQNAMSMFGINRRLLGAIVGHLAAFEMTSSLPNRMYGDGFRRLGFGADVTEYFDEHVEADAVHEQIAARDLAGGLGEDRPDLIADIFFGAAACLALDDRVADGMRAAFEGGRSSLRPGAELPARVHE